MLRFYYIKRKAGIVHRSVAPEAGESGRKALVCLHAFLSRNTDIGTLSPYLSITGADRTAVLAARGPGVDHCLPHMAGGALPPDLFVAAYGHHSGCQCAVQVGVPLCGDHRLFGLQVVKPGKDLSPGAIRAGGERFCALGNDCRIFMPKFAHPPDPAIAVYRHICGQQGTVL